jgi:hypothetical protein
MRICFTINGIRHCYYIPIVLYPIQIPKPHPPENYEYLVSDATIVATIADLAGKLSDNRVGEAIQGGVQGALKAMQTHAGQGVEIQLTSARG